MGMFDNITCDYKTEPPTKGIHFQTKDTPAQYLDKYEIREDGTLWHEDYDIEDRSNPNAKGLLRFCGLQSKVNKRWEQIFLTGEIQFYNYGDDDELDYSAYFVKGKLKELHFIGVLQSPDVSERLQDD